MSNELDRSGNETTVAGMQEDNVEQKMTEEFDNVFEDEEKQFYHEGRITDQDLDRLIGPLPSRRPVNNALETYPTSLEVEDDWSRKKKDLKPPSHFCVCCPSFGRRHGSEPMFTTSTKLGNVFIWSPRCFNQFGFGVIGPHWFGPICVVGLETIATFYYYPLAKNNVGAISAVICVMFYILGLFSLSLVSCSDPGIVNRLEDEINETVGKNGYATVPKTERNITARAGWRYCDLCSVYQPPGAMHCPECNVCVEGYDHHCPWMGQW